MKQMLPVSVNSTEPRLQTTVRQLGLESSLRQTQGWLKLIIYTSWYVRHSGLKRVYVCESLSGNVYCKVRVCKLVLDSATTCSWNKHVNNSEHLLRMRVKSQLEIKLSAYKQEYITHH